MRSSASQRTVLAVLAIAWIVGSGAVAGATPKSAYTQAVGREEILRREMDAGPKAEGVSAVLRRIRVLVAQYERLAERYRASGYSDNALFNAARLSADAFWQFGDEIDRRQALRLFAAVRAQFPTSSLVRQASNERKRLDQAPRATATSTVSTSTPTPSPAAVTSERPVLRSIRREVLTEAVRVTLELERETPFHEERLEGPPRVFIDLQDTRTTQELRDATLAFEDDIIRQIRVGRHVGSTRVVLDLERSARHSVYALYNPYRVVIDFERERTTAAQDTSITRDGKQTREEPGATWTPAPAAAPAEPAAPTHPPAGAPTSAARVAPRRETGAASTTDSRSAPSPNRAGGFSIARQLGLGISRVVIDAGHGGHDPGARVKGLNEADITLDVAQRLEKLLLLQPGVEVIMTRRGNVYIPLEERTAIANRSGADLFLSIHVNASRNTGARGIETYFLNFAPNPEAEAIAARENAGSSKTMRNLPDIVRAIALNNKIDESRDFAALVQAAMIARLKKANAQARSLGVKQAPFMVLIGATMPSVLAEISFLTNRQEGALLRKPSYRQAVAEALLDGISKYQRSLKASQTVASQ